MSHATDLHMPALRIGTFELRSRLILGTGRYHSFGEMQESHMAAEADCVTVAVRREKLHDSQGNNILDFLDLDRLTLLPNTAGCYEAKSAVRVAKMGREILTGLDNPGADWVKLEVLGDSRTLLPDPIETLKATEELVKEGFQVLCYTNDDPVIAMKLKQAGAVAVMPGGSPIGSGRGIANPHNLLIILEQLKADDPDFPVIVDAGVGTPSDVVIALELGADAVLLNTAVARAKNPVNMAVAMKFAAQAGYLGRQSGRIGAAAYGSASSPEYGMISETPTSNRLKSTS
ncbi:MAG: thiazole synthase [Pirellulaceae bacterium]|nr:thiazole synthase [Pirellulaceae bacterium]